MARSRNIKPGFFRNSDLLDLPYEARLLFAGLWMLADRDGRMEDKPKQIKIEIFPADNLDCDALIESLAEKEMLVRYEIDGKRYLQVVNFTKHQNPHRDEKASTIPDQCGNYAESVVIPKKHRANTVQAPCKEDANTVAIGLIPDSGLLIPDSGLLIPERKPVARGSRLPENFEPDFEFAISEGIKNTLEEANKFRDYWNSTPGQKGVKLDWQATWRNWCRNVKPSFSNSRTSSSTLNKQEELEARNQKVVDDWLSRGEVIETH